MYENVKSSNQTNLRDWSNIDIVQASFASSLTPTQKQTTAQCQIWYVLHNHRIEPTTVWRYESMKRLMGSANDCQ